MSNLTPRQIQILDLICQGKSSKIIAAELSKTTKAIEMCVARLIKKLKANNRSHAVAIYLKK
jgi:DNA-binding NarL/FixJ family response regulator